MKEISEELLKRLDVLAQQMGTTIDHLWQVLVQQAYVEAYLAIFWLIISTVMVTVCFRFVMASVKLDKEDECSNGRIFVSIGLAIVAVGFLVTACWKISSIGYLFNPEFYALDQVRHFFGK